MRIDVITIFPEMFTGPFGASITKRAVEKGILDIHLTNFRDYSFDTIMSMIRRSAAARAWC